MAYDSSGRNKYNGDRRPSNRSFRDRSDYIDSYNEDRRSSDSSRRSFRSDEGMRRNGYDRDNYNPRPYNNSRNYDQYPMRSHDNIRSYDNARSRDNVRPYDSARHYNTRSYDNQPRNTENRRSYIQPRERRIKKTKEELDRELSVYMAATK